MGGRAASSSRPAPAGTFLMAPPTVVPPHAMVNNAADRGSRYRKAGGAAARERVQSRDLGRSSRRGRKRWERGRVAQVPSNPGRGRRQNTRPGLLAYHVILTFTPCSCRNVFRSRTRWPPKWTIEAMGAASAHPSSSTCAKSSGEPGVLISGIQLPATCNYKDPDASLRGGRAELAGCLVNSIGTAPAFGAHMVYILCCERGANLGMEGDDPLPEHLGAQFVKRLCFTTGVRPAILFVLFQPRRDTAKARQQRR